MKGTTTIGQFEDARELDDGYALAYPRTEKWRKRLEQFALSIRQRESLYAVEIVEEDGDPAHLWLHLTGPPKAKSFLADFVAFGKAGKFETVHRVRLSLRGRAMLCANRVLRRATSPARLLPDFFVIGAAKCGTTSLYFDLGTHPSIGVASRKEVYFFDHAYRKGLQYYRSFFPTVLEKRRVERSGATPFRTGEATPCYLFHPHVPRRIAAHVPGARLVVLLRNPVDRAYSEYRMKQRMGYEDLSFEEAIEREPARVDGELDKMLEDEHYFSYNRWHFSYLGRGRYAEQLENWLASFPREQILVLASEDFFNAPAETYAALMAHIGLPPWAPPTNQKANFSPYTDLDETTRGRLVEHFRPYNQQLYALLGRKFDWDR